MKTRRDQQAVWHRGNLDEPHRVEDKARRVRAMFDAVAPTYELVNTLTSLGRDAYWRRRAVELARVSAEDRVLDVACGTGDLARAFAAVRPRPAVVVGADFSREMMRLAPGSSNGWIRWCQADALLLPFADKEFTVVSCAFGVRNFEDLAAGLGQMQRALASGGRVVILEFSLPVRPVLRQLFLFYFRHVLPWIGTFVSGDRSGAYRYLPRSVLRLGKRREIVELLGKAGFAKVQVHPLTFGIAVVYLATKP